MQYRLLGPVKAFTENRRISLPPRTQLFLASLVLAEGRRVGNQSLAQRIWDGDDPVDPADQLRACASELRRELDDKTLVQSDNNGYRMRLEWDQADVLRFRRRAKEARLCAGDHAKAVRLGREALSEWGPDTAEPAEALAGLSGAWADGLRRTLRDERRDALVDLYRAELRLGRNADLVAQIRAAADEVGRDDEELTELLMLACMQRNQPGAALDAYDRNRDALRRKGLTRPGERLRLLEGRIREEDPVLAAMYAPATDSALVPVSETRSDGGGTDARERDRTDAPDGDRSGEAGDADQKRSREPDEGARGERHTAAAAPVFINTAQGNAQVGVQGIHHGNIQLGHPAEPASRRRAEREQG
ncbi:BTAD domain-containing putative transcriptional regulator [Actinomadura viridis]|uniref:AfsR/SARP family transcriptional regulator n=1 Tax=Actinomadura viridis TaxID=58110 RepID=UPI0036CE10FD